MSYGNRLEDGIAGRNVDVLLAKVGLVAAVLLLGLRLLAEQVFLVVIPVAIGSACATYLAIHDRKMHEVTVPGFPAGAAGYLPAAVVAGLAALTAAVTFTDGRSVPVLLLTGVVGSLLLAQILLVDDAAFSPGVVLFEILLATVVIRLTALFAVPGFVGADVWVHGPIWVDGVAESGSLEPLSESKYLFAPFYHAVGAVGELLAGSARAGIYLTVGVFVPLSAVFVYGIGSLFVPARWALFATALYAFADQFVRWGLHLIPTSLGLAFFIATLYCVLTLLMDDAQPWAVLGLFAFGLAVVFTHQVSTAILLATLAVAAVVALLTGLRSSGGVGRRSVVLAVAFVVHLAVTVATWAMAPWTGGGAGVEEQGFLFRMLAVAQSAIFTDAGFLDLVSTGSEGAGGAGGAGSETLAATLIPYVELFGFALLLAAAVVGSLVMLRWRQRMDATLTLLAVGAVLFVGTFGLTLFGIRVFQPGRWIGFLYVPLAVVAAVGVYYVAERAPRGVLAGVVLLFALGYPTTMVVAEKATLDDPAFEDRYSRTAFTESELAAAETVPEVLPPAEAERVRTDHPYWRAFHPEAAGRLVTLVMSEDGPVQETPVVYRTYQSSGATSIAVVVDGERVRTQRAYERSEVCPNDWNLVYANDDVVLCTPTTADGGASA